LLKILSPIYKEIGSNAYSALIFHILIPSSSLEEFIKDFRNTFLMKKMVPSEKRVQKVFPKAILADGIEVAGSSQCNPMHKQVLLKRVKRF
jgi:hypothetical protein